MLITRDQINHRFTNHPPKNEGVADALDEITSTVIQTGQVFADILPECREASLALTHLEQASMFAKAAIARNQGDG